MCKLVEEQIPSTKNLVRPSEEYIKGREPPKPRPPSRSLKARTSPLSSQTHPKHLTNPVRIANIESPSCSLAGLEMESSDWVECQRRGGSHVYPWKWYGKNRGVGIVWSGSLCTPLPCVSGLCGDKVEVEQLAMRLIVIEIKNLSAIVMRC